LLDKTQPPEVLRDIIASCPDTLSIEGGEPTLCRDLDIWVRRAHRQGIRDIILCTNGARFCDEAYVRKLCDCGVTLFNVNFPAHEEKLFSILTRTSGQFQKRVAALRTLIAVAGGKRVRLNMVVNRLNFLVIPQYVRFVKERFPEVFYIEFNLVKVLGRVERRPYLVPRLQDAAPVLVRALRYMTRARMKFIIDGFPLCALDGYEHAAIDAAKRYFHDDLYLDEKAKTRKCAGCSLGGLCAGPRKDYVSLHGDLELAPSRKDPGPIIAKLQAMASKP